MRQPFCAMGVYQPKSLPHYGKRRQFNEIVTLHRMKRSPRRCGWIIYTIQARAPYNDEFVYFLEYPKREKKPKLKFRKIKTIL